MKNNITHLLFSFLLFFLCSITLFAQTGQLDSTYGNNGKQNFADFHPYLFYESDIVRIDQSENSFMLVGDILRTDNAGKMWMPLWKFKNDLAIKELQVLISDEPAIFSLKCAISPDSGFSEKVIVAGGKDNDLFIKQFDSDGNTANIGIHPEIIRNLGGNEHVSSMVRLDDGSFIVFAKTSNKVICLKLNSNGNWNGVFGNDGVVEIAAPGDFRVFSVLAEDNDVYFTTGTNQLHKISPAGVLNEDFYDLARLYLDLQISDLYVMPDGGLLVSGNEFASPKSLVINKINPDGSLNTSFGNQGKSVVHYTGNFNSINSVQVFKNRIYVGGGIDLKFFLAKLTIDGDLVNSFGDEGIVLVGFGNSICEVFDVKLHENGTALLLGERQGWLAGARLIVASTPTVNVSASTLDVCKGESFQLFSSGADTYHWSGNDGFESFLQNPLVSISESYAGSQVFYTLTGANEDGFTDVIQIIVNIKPDVKATYSEELPCFGQTENHKVTILKGNNYDENVITIYNDNNATLISEDATTAVFEFDLDDSPLEVSFVDTLNRYCETGISVDFETNDAITATIEVTSLDTSCIGVIFPDVENDPLLYLWSNGNTNKIAGDLPRGPFSVTIANTITGCTASFEGECLPLLKSDGYEITKNEIFPNPVNDVLNIRLLQAVGITSLTILNAQGREVIKTNKFTISEDNLSVDVSDLTGGIYFLQLNNVQGKLKMGKFVKL